MNLNQQIKGLDLDKYISWSEEIEFITLELKDYDIVIRAECTFHTCDGETNRSGIPKKVFTHLDSKAIKVLDIYTNLDQPNKDEVQSILNDKL